MVVEMILTHNEVEYSLDQKYIGRENKCFDYHLEDMKKQNSITP